MSWKGSELHQIISLYDLEITLLSDNELGMIYRNKNRNLKLSIASDISDSGALLFKHWAHNPKVRGSNPLPSTINASHSINYRNNTNLVLWKAINPKVRIILSSIFYRSFLLGEFSLNDLRVLSTLLSQNVHPANEKPIACVHHTDF